MKKERKKKVQQLKASFEIDSQFKMILMGVCERDESNSIYLLLNI